MRINLLPVNERPLKQSSIRWDFLVVFFGVVLLLAVNLFAYFQSIRIEALQQDYENLLSYKSLLLEQQRQIVQIQNANQELRTRIDYYEQILANSKLVLPSEELALVIASVPEQVWLETVELSSTNIAVSGYAVESPSITMFLQNLIHHGYDAEVDKIEQSSIGGRLFSFTINAQRRD